MNGGIYNKEGTVLQEGFHCENGNFFIPEGVKCIGKDAFYEVLSLKSIVLPSTLTSIEYMAFCGCASLQEVKIPNSVTNIGNCTFMDCCLLKSVSLSSSIKTIGEKVFYGCSSLTKIIPYGTKDVYKDKSIIKIPEGVTSIKQGAFVYCASIINVDMPDTITSIGDEAFRDCKRLSHIKFSKNTNIGKDVFIGSPLDEDSKLQLKKIKERINAR